MKLYLLCFLAIISCIKIQGQNYENNKNEFESEYREETIRNSDYVFEGSIVKLSLYRRDNKCVTSYIVKVKEILRGDSLLKLGTVEVLNYSEACYEYRDTADLIKYELETVGFFFCRKANEFNYDPQFNIDKVDNNVILTGYHNNKIYELDWIGKTSSGGAYYSGLFKKYDTKYDVYKELKNFPDLKLPHKIEPQKLTAREASFGEIRTFTKEQVDSIIEDQNRRSLFPKRNFTILVKHEKDSIVSLELPFVEIPLNYDSTNHPIQVRVGIKADIDFVKTATLIKKHRKKLYFSMRVNSPNALALSFVFKKFKIPINSAFNIYSINQDTIYDKYTGEFERICQRLESQECETRNVLLLLEISKKEIKNCKINIETIYHTFRKIVIKP